MDALVEDVHFRRDWTTPRALGRKAMAVNVSDLAASGARPVAAFVSLALGENDTVEWVEEIYAGFEEMAQEFNFTVAGGDTVKSQGGTMISVALIGEVLNPERGPVLRAGAQARDVLLVTGTLGDSAAGLALLLNPTADVSPETRQYLLQRHHEPTPRLRMMRSLLKCDPTALNAALDLSDGIVGDAVHLARRSALRLEIQSEQLPISRQCREAAAALGVDPLEWALTGGEDYELLLAVPPQWAQELSANGLNGETLTSVGNCLDSDGSAGEVIVNWNGIPRKPAQAWTHF
jgi:thiamine-monophosphate kinase